MREEAEGNMKWAGLGWAACFVCDEGDMDDVNDSRSILERELEGDKRSLWMKVVGGRGSDLIIHAPRTHVKDIGGGGEREGNRASVILGFRARLTHTICAERYVRKCRNRPR